MPQIILEYSDNIIEQDSFAEFFEKTHQILVETLPTKLEDCKSRAIKQDNYYIGNGAADNAFVYAYIQAKAGRSEAVLRATEQKLLALLQDHFAESKRQLNLQITLQIRELSPYYSKI